ncbi:hypothetical protein CUS_5238 [Ruminococcus albus 8]|uniref:Uncharacterized protein n=1 Tax=Ruminococcus albus 8 TaxID=246199 RepID=E9SFH2_RUMAL|nr:hypothetical protein CUS_5238 [Ruminococcus albus 8]
MLAKPLSVERGKKVSTAKILADSSMQISAAEESRDWLFIF